MSTKCSSACGNKMVTTFAHPKNGCQFPAAILQFTGKMADKARMLLVLLYIHIPKRGELVLIMCQWPCCQRLLELVLHMCGFNVLSIKSNMGPEERAETIAMLKSQPEKFHGMISTVDVLGFGANLQFVPVLIVPDPVPSLASGFSAIGRVHRVGSVSEQFVYFLFMALEID